jgi:hypothetical protein
VVRQQHAQRNESGGATAARFILKQNYSRRVHPEAELQRLPLSLSLDHGSAELPFLLKMS